jgi:hypothetical protein
MVRTNHFLSEFLERACNTVFGRLLLQDSKLVRVQAAAGPVAPSWATLLVSRKSGEFCSTHAQSAFRPP